MAIGDSTTVKNASFKSAHSALVFAFHFSSQYYDRPAMNKLASPSLGSGKGLVGLDGAGQAGMIRARVKSLGVRMEAALIARCAPPSMPCDCGAPCCGGWKTNREWFDAITELSYYVESLLADTTTDAKLRIKSIERHFTERDLREGLEDIAAHGSINKQTAGQHFRKISNLLAEIESSAQCAIEKALCASGMIEGQMGVVEVYN